MKPTVVITIVLLGSIATSSLAQGCLIDQAQTSANYGFWFEISITRWQQFVPSQPYLCGIEVLLERQGSAGNVVLEIQDAAASVLWQGTIPQASVITGWNMLHIGPVVALTPGQLYSLNVRTDQTSTSAQNRYFWRGQTATNPYPAGISDPDPVGWPGFDFAFRTWAQATPETVSFLPSNTVSPGASVQVIYSAPAHGGEIFLPYVSCTLGTTPLVPGITLPAVLDVCSDFYFTTPGATSIFMLAPPGTFAGVLDAAGQATGTVAIPATFPIGLNLSLYIGFVTISGTTLTGSSQVGTLTLL